jgi:hypothetical protein
VTYRPSAGDREGVVGRLRDGLLEDRLSPETFSARLDRAYGAHNRAQLDELVADLPKRRPTGDALRVAVGSVSRWAASLRAAWHDARAPRLALTSRSSVTFGRSRACDCVLLDPTVSRQHASLRHVEGSWFLRDLRSANGTSVNGWRVLGEVEVRPGDRVTFGAVTYRLGSPQR